MVFLGALENGVNAENDLDDDECQGMSIAQIHQKFSPNKDGSDVEMPVFEEEEEQSQVGSVGSVGIEDSISDDGLVDWLACFSGNKDEPEIEELHDPECVHLVTKEMGLCLTNTFRTLLWSRMRVTCTGTTSQLPRQSIHLLLKIVPNSIKILWII